MGFFPLKKYSDSPIDKKKYSVQLGDKILNPDLREKKNQTQTKKHTPLNVEVKWLSRSPYLHIHQDG